MIRFTIGILVVTLFLVPGTLAQSASASDFERDIRPILASRCVSCHGPTRQRGGLRLDRREDALRGGDSGPVLGKGKSETSSLLRRVTSRQVDERMPPTGDPLTPQQIAHLRAWIEAGAPWPESAAGASDTLHWAFRPVVRPPIPTLRGADWARNPVDRFLLARLEAEGLSPSPIADRRTLLRRLMFDVLGLPPTPSEVEAHVADPRPDAHERLVDRLLGSVHHGERWARHWLDVVRFAESHGFEMNQARPNAWPYRDYVIGAFNADKPYDRFVKEQIAGDLLGADEATGFLVGGPWDQVKSPDIGLTLQQRADELHDMVGTTGSTFLGLTIGCARCHNHKFDPVSQTDYYALTACLAGVQHGERPWRREPSMPREDPETLRRQLDAIIARLQEDEPLAAPNGPAGRRLPANARRNVERFPPIQARYVRFTVLATNSAEPCLDELEVWTTGATRRNVALASAGAKATSSGNFAGAPTLHRLEHLNDGRYGNSRSWISHERGQGWVQVEFPEAVEVETIVWGRDREGKFADRLPIRYRIEAALMLDRWQTVASSEDRLVFGAAAPRIPPALRGAARVAYEKAIEERASLEKRLQDLEKGLLYYGGKFTTPEPTHRLHRGDPLARRELVAPASLTQIGPTWHLVPTAAENERRLALANWLVDRRNPLTARVAVNRLWHHHFGRGLVETPSDLGRNGARPSHPELLDWLADELMRNDWSLKAIHRLILTSAAYQQSSAANEAGLRKDAGTRWLWRYPPRRLEAEAVRDAILTVSGRLNRRMGGPGFDLFESNANYVKVYNSRKVFGPEEFRRLVYQSKPRMQLDDTFGAFDCPDAGQTTARRNSSTTPLQALNLLNSPFLLQQAAFFAERLRQDAGGDGDEQIRLAFQQAFGREPAEEERAGARELIQAHGLEAFCRAMLNANEMLSVF